MTKEDNFYASTGNEIYELLWNTVKDMCGNYAGTNGGFIMDGKKVFLAAHRGDKLKFPENTIPASSATMGAECLLQITYMMQTEYLKNLK